MLCILYVLCILHVIYCTVEDFKLYMQKADLIQVRLFKKVENVFFFEMQVFSWCFFS